MNEGNQFWKQRSRHGRHKLFKTPDLMLEAAREYFTWCEENPLMETDFRGKDSDEIEIPHPRPFTMIGLCIYLGCNTKYFYLFERDKKRCTPKFSEIIEHIKEVIHEQKFAGAATGFFNANIISRDLGLVDKADITSKGEALPQTVIKWGDKIIKV